MALSTQGTRPMSKNDFIRIILEKAPNTRVHDYPLLFYIKEEFPDKPSAMSAEALFKRKTRQQKLEYIADKKK